jgi:phage regulator Rha-like protein
MTPSTVNQLATTGNLLSTGALSMTSREIAELVEKRHDNVKTLIESLAAQGVIILPEFQEVSNTGPGPKTIGIYRFTGDQGRRDSIVVVAQLSPAFTGRLVDRWQELEAAVSFALPKDYPSALRALADVHEAHQAALLQIEVDRPYAALGRAMTDTNETMVRRDWVNLMKTDHGLPVGEKKVNQWLIDSGYCYRENITRELRAYAQHAHLLRLVPSVVTHKDGRKLAVPLLKLTGEGILQLTHLVLAHFVGEPQ